jgi:hypothetical protein
VFALRLIANFSCLRKTNSNKPKHSSIDANPKIKKLKEKQVTSSIIEPTILARLNSTTQTISDNKIKKKRLTGASKKLKKLNQKHIAVNNNQLNT